MHTHTHIVEPHPDTRYLMQQKKSNNGSKYGTSDDDAPPLELATPTGFQVSHIPKGYLVFVCQTCY